MDGENESLFDENDVDSIDKFSLDITFMDDEMSEDVAIKYVRYIIKVLNGIKESEYNSNRVLSFTLFISKYTNWSCKRYW